MSSAIVRSIDVGYGHTKFTLKQVAGEEPVCSMFPSLAPQTEAKPELNSEFMMKRQTIIVKVGDSHYEVGKDSALAVDPYYTREQDTRYSLSDSHMALVRGALYYMGVPKIDMLMLGLPCSTFEQFKDKLKQRMIGAHEIPNYAPRGDKAPRVVDVEVGMVNVLPQPMGAYFDYALRNKLLDRLRTQRTLIVDPGYFTLDWVVAEGTKMVGDRSHGHNNGGVKSLIDKIAAELGKEVGEPITDLTIIERALQTKTPARLAGREYDLTKYLGRALALAKQHVAALTAKVGSGMDIDSIILAGGGAELFKEAVASKFPKHTIHVTDDPAYANVRGFQLLALDWARKQKTLEARTAKQA